MMDAFDWQESAACRLEDARRRGKARLKTGAIIDVDAGAMPGLTNLRTKDMRRAPR